jgi:putative sterol carrier protein
MIDPGIAARIAASPELKKELKGVTQFIIDGTPTHLIVGDTVSVVQGKHEKPDVTLTMTAELFLEVVAGKADAQMAFYDGRITIKGAQTIAVALFRKVLR